MQLKKFIETTCNKPISECSNQELYLALLSYTKEQIKEKETPCNDKKKLYYISAEFLIGKLLSNNLINLGMYEEVALLLKGTERAWLRSRKPSRNPPLETGGLGRLAACFLDSIATLGLPGDGVGLNYHLGLFRRFWDHLQKETPNPWIEKESWLHKTDTTYRIALETSRYIPLYDIDVSGTTTAVTIFIFSMWRR